MRPEDPQAAFRVLRFSKDSSSLCLEAGNIPENRNKLPRVQRGNLRSLLCVFFFYPSALPEDCPPRHQTL